MKEEKAPEPEIVSRKDALENFKTALQKGGFPHCEKLKGKQEILQYYLFEEGWYSFWELVNDSKSVMGLNRVAILHYGPGVLEEKPVKAADIEKELKQICESINAFCAEGTARNEILMTLSHLLKKKLKEECGLDIKPLVNENLLVQLREVVRENSDAIIKAVAKQGARPKKDLIIAYLLAVFKKVFPEETPSRGYQSLFFNFTLTAMQSCAPDHHLSGMDRISAKLEARLKPVVKKGQEWFEYDEERDRITPIKNLYLIVRDYPELAEMRQIDYGFSDTVI